MAGQVFTIREAAMYLFGDDSQSAYYKARRAINELDYVKRGRSVYIAKSKLDEAFGITGVPSAGSDLRPNEGPIPDPYSER
mgnify:CR=1 FL=1